MRWVFYTIAIFAITFGQSAADAKTLFKTARSGQPTLMYKYANWKSDCSPDTGIVKLVTKPQHGKAAPQRATIPIGPSRYYGITKCHGKPTHGFLVYYTSVPGFRGTDSFTIEVTYPKHAPEIDSFTIHVE